jgi:signal transduction histidine kinase
VRAFAEAVALAALLAPPFLVGDGTRAGDLAFGLVVGPLCAILFSARARLRGGARQGKLAREGFTTLLFAASCAAIGALPAAQNGSADPAVLVAAALCAWNFGALAFFRALAYLWPRWVALRRGRLRWEMTHATLVVVALVAAALVLAAVLVSLATGLFVPEDAGSLSATERAASGLLALGIAVFLTVAALGLLLPPAAAVSYFVARRTARRLESLARGAEDLREGNLAARVEVDGEDEVSSLQKDFNAMADDLQNAMRGLRSERDRVARLLTAQRELVASVSHELRTPLATVRGYLEWALGREDAVVVEVEDTGEGMPPEDLGRVFERFWRSEDARRIDRAGAGLGLALVRELVEAMGGTVSVESEPGVGSRFRVRLARDRA